MTEKIQKNMQAEIEKYNKVQKDYHKTLSQRQQLDGQLNENIAVKKELDALKSEDEVFKLIGPVLIKQDLSEAKQNVAKRMEYIGAELKRVEEALVVLDKKKDTHCKTLEKYQKMFEQALIKATFSQPKA